MPNVTIALPDPRPDPLLRQLGEQFKALQKHLMAGKRQTEAAQTPMLRMMMKQQDGLLRALERLMTSMTKREDTGTLAPVLKQLQRFMQELPDDLSASLTSAYKKVVASSTRPQVTVKPSVTVSMNGLEKRLDRMQNAIVTATKRSRSRTFGSNY